MLISETDAYVLLYHYNVYTLLRFDSDSVHVDEFTTGEDVYDVTPKGSEREITEMQRPYMVSYVYYVFVVLHPKIICMQSITQCIVEDRRQVSAHDIM